MAEAGKFNTLRVVKQLDFGMYLDGGESGEILLPTRYIPENTEVGDEIEVFLYYDSEDRIIATTEKPLATVDEFACLQVVQVTPIGAFLDWGLMKDLFLPFKEQKHKVKPEQDIVVYIYIDPETNRIVASAKVEKFLKDSTFIYEIGEEVDILIFAATDLGFKAIINNSHEGILYLNEVFEELFRGDRKKAFIKKVREDGKIDLTLYKQGYEKVEDSAGVILDYLKKNGGQLHLHDKSPSEEISKVLGISKKTFKKAIGQLYKKRLIEISSDGIRLV